MQRHARLISRIASLGLGFVFVALIACTFWASARIARATDRVGGAVSLSDLYTTLNGDLSVQDALASRHQNDLNPRGWNQQLEASVATHETLVTIARTSAADRKLAERSLKLHQQYFEGLVALYSDVDSGAPMLAKIVGEKVVDPLYREIQAEIQTRAADQHRRALDALADLTATQQFNRRTLFVAAMLGLFQVAVCALVLAGYQRKVEQAQRAELAALEQTSLTDNLTGLANHRAFVEELDAQLARVARHGGIISLAVLDVDEFKSVNDRGGHLLGDRVLAAMGVLLSEVRKSDRTFRIGGDEFAIVLPDASTIEASIIMERIRQAAAERLFGATLSVGIATTTSHQAVDATALRAQADAALYAAKQSGRNTVLTYADAESGQLVLSPAKAQVVRDLIRDGQLDVVFQPIWDSENGVPFGFEALARPSPSYGLAGPQEAFEIAERIGRAPALDAVCLAAILARAAELPSDALLFINIVPETLDRDLLPGSTLLEAVDRAGIPPERVVIELTERAMPRLEVIVREAKRLGSLGFKLALDDTGAGNAGLEVLRQLPVDFVKIDRAVVMQAMTEPTARAIVASIAAIAHTMGACVVAEGIETIEALDFVRRDVMLGWHRNTAIRGVQGYLLGRPAHAPWTCSTFDEQALLLRTAPDSAKRAPVARRRLVRSVQRKSACV